ncbi:hypothetical protein CBOM_03533 [Ceraceosorus bombacis]|uniref:Uncharacterized protein n=1 Tax=Ceraceosorus bombacis TaxID=401625 RepID=A0A0P1BGV0_9BASI|nr:hypothetical protein CBOM_03533 [Ceraceosorus bombacis]
MCIENATAERFCGMSSRAAKLLVRLLGWTTLHQRLARADSEAFFCSIGAQSIVGEQEEAVDLLLELRKLNEQLARGWDELRLKLRKLNGQLAKGWDELRSSARVCRWSSIKLDLGLSVHNLSAYHERPSTCWLVVFLSLALLDISIDLFAPVQAGHLEVLPGQISPDIYLLVLCYGLIRGRGSSHFRWSGILYDFIVKRLANKSTLFALHSGSLKASSPAYYAAVIVPGLLTGGARVFSEPLLRWSQRREIKKMVQAIRASSDARLDFFVEVLQELNKKQLTLVVQINERRREGQLAMTDETAIGNDVDRIANLANLFSMLSTKEVPSRIPHDNKTEKTIPLGGGVLVGLIWMSLSYRSPVLLAGSSMHTGVLLGQLIWMFKNPGYSPAEMRRLVQEKLSAILVTTSTVGAILYARGTGAFEQKCILATVCVLTNGFELVAGNMLSTAVDCMVERVLELWRTLSRRLKQVEAEKNSHA